MIANSSLSFLFLCSRICCMHQYATCNLFPGVAAPQPGVDQNKATRNRQPTGSVTLLEGPLCWDPGHVNSKSCLKPHSNCVKTSLPLLPPLLCLNLSYWLTERGLLLPSRLCSSTRHQTRSRLRSPSATQDALTGS